MAEPREAIVVHTEPLSDGLHRLVLRPVIPVVGRAGQRLAVATTLPNPDKPGDVLRRAWSVAAVHTDGALELIVAVVGGCTRWLAECVEGERLSFSGPWGTKFTMEAGRHPVALVATGSGISPVGALVEEALASGRSVALWWDLDEAGGVLQDRFVRWRTLGAKLNLGALPDGSRSLPDGEAFVGAEWWLAGDGDRLDALATTLAEGGALVHLERFYPLKPRSA